MDEIVKIKVSDEYFNIEDTLCCGQVFRFARHKDGYMVRSSDKSAYCHGADGITIVECAAGDEEYFRNYFDLNRDYSEIFHAAEQSGYEILKTSARLGKGIRILNQDRAEALFSFVISQNNNIPRIKSIIERICASLGEEREFFGDKFYAFPTAESFAGKDAEFYAGLGLGYRAEYISRLAREMADGFSLDEIAVMPTSQLRERLIRIRGVGPKVADCAVLFGFHRSDSFPVDTWIEKVYSENFGGTLKDRKKISERFVGEFGENAGYFQQYLFYYKRSLEKTLNCDNRR